MITLYFIWSINQKAVDETMGILLEIHFLFNNLYELIHLAF